MRTSLLARRRLDGPAGLAVLVGSLVWAPMAAAQAPALLQGVVVDQAASTPVGSATLTLVGTDIRALSLPNGTFAFADAPLGRVGVRVDAPGYTSVVQEVEVRSGRVAFVQFLLPSLSAVLDEILVAARRPDRSLALSEPRTAADLLAAKIPGVMSSPGELGVESSRMRLRGVGSMTQVNDPAVFLDGIRLAGGLREAMSLLRQIPASAVRDIEVLRGPAAGFLQGAADGAIRIRTRSGSN